MMLYTYQRHVVGQVIQTKCEFKSLIHYQIFVKNLTYTGSGYQKDLCNKAKKGMMAKIFYSEADPNINTLRKPYKELTEACSILVTVLLLIPTILTRIICNSINARKF